MNQEEQWHEVTVELEEDAWEDLAPLLFAAGAQGTWVQDLDSERVRAVAYFNGWDRNLEEHIRSLCEGRHIQISLSESKDFVLEFQKQWTAFTIAPDVWVVPSWERAHFSTTKPTEVVLYLDPGTAFGTGHHETTSLCARALVALSEQLQDKRVWDLGTGTGILGMLAVKLGAKEAYLTDIDPKACRMAKENAMNNGLLQQVHVQERIPDGQFDCVVANILSEPLMDMAPIVVEHLQSGGVLLLSGILRHQADDVVSAYRAQGLKYLHSHHDGEWTLLAFR